MRKTSLALLGLVLTLGTAAPALAQPSGRASSPSKTPPPAELAPTIGAFRVVSTPMPMSPGYYGGYPSGDNLISQGTGHSDQLRGFYSQTRQVAPKFLAHDKRLDDDVGVFEDTVREQGDKVLRTMRGPSFGASLRETNRSSNQRLQVLLNEYNDHVHDARKARIAHQSAQKTAEGARFQLQASDADSKECSLLMEKSKAEARKAEVMARVARSDWFLNGVEKLATSLATGGPSAAIAYLGGEIGSATTGALKTAIRETIYASEMETLYQVGLEIEAIDKALAAQRCSKQKATLQQARANLEAKTLDVLLTAGGPVEHRMKAWRTLDLLATLRGRDGKPLATFKELRDYNSQVNTMGRKLFDSVTAYEQFLWQDPISRGDAMLAGVREDKAYVAANAARMDPKGSWRARWGGLEDFFVHYTRWYKAETDRGQVVLELLREGRHLAFVDYVVARSLKELGATVAPEDIIP